LNPRRQDSKFKIQDLKKKMNPRRQDSKFKIQDLKKKMNPRRQDSRFKISKQLLESKEAGFKIQDSRSKKTS